MIIPTLNAEDEISALLDNLTHQSVVPDEIVVIDSSSTDNTVEIARTYPHVKVEVINRAEFNHGLTRDKALRATKGDYVLFLTQDAIPANTEYIASLIAPLEQDASIAMVSGRQLPKPDARRFEQLVRAYNYDDNSYVRAKSDISTYGIKTFFVTDVCSAYRRSAYIECGGFDEVCTSEDIVMAARFIYAGYKIAYAANAQVIHSHNLTFKQQYRRNFAIGKTLAQFPELFSDISEVGEGASLAKKVSTQLLKEARILELCGFALDCCARIVGNRAGRRSVEAHV